MNKGYNLIFKIKHLFFNFLLMKKLLVLLFVSIFLVSCWGTDNEVVDDTLNQEVQDTVINEEVQTGDVNTESDSDLAEEDVLLDALLESYESESSNQTEEENLDELIDILFDTTY